MNEFTIPIGSPTERTDRSTLPSNQFPFYLEAWVYCRKNNLDQSKIRRKNWNLWEVDLAGVQS